MFLSEQYQSVFHVQPLWLSRRKDSFKAMTDPRPRQLRRAVQFMLDMIKFQVIFVQIVWRRPSVHKIPNCLENGVVLRRTINLFLWEGVKLLKKVSTTNSLFEVAFWVSTGNRESTSTVFVFPDLWATVESYRRWRADHLDNHSRVISSLTSPCISLSSCGGF